MDISKMDPLTAKLAVELLLGDINEALDELYTDLPAGDQRSGYEVLKHDLEHQLRDLECQVLAINMLMQERDQHVATQAAITKLCEEEQQATRDHAIACTLAGIAVAAPRRAVENDPKNVPGLGNEEEDEYEKIAAYYSTRRLPDIHNDREEGPGLGNGESSSRSQKGFTSTAAKKTKYIEPTRLCVACQEYVRASETIKVDCEPEPHHYCHPCLVALFQTSVNGHTLFPPRCCRKVIPLSMCKGLLTKTFIEDFELKIEELATPNPTFCYNPKCANPKAKFIRPAHINDEIGTCLSCTEKTCTICKLKAHVGDLCPEDEGAKQLKTTAEKLNWMRCEKCRNMVELHTGCYHMTCICKHEFCYLCGKVWQTCNCPLWEEDRLIAPPVPDRVVCGRAEDSHHWERLRAPRLRCAGCDPGRHLPWLWHCLWCGIHNCARCRFNRV